jgi:hypothetical protein
MLKSILLIIILWSIINFNVYGIDNNVPEMAGFVIIFERGGTYEEEKHALIEQFRELQQAGKLTPILFVELIREYGIHSVLYAAFNEADRQFAQQIYIDILLLNPPAPDDIRYPSAFFLSTLTQECENTELFMAMKDEQDLNLAIVIAKAFIKSRNHELQNIAITWAKVLRETESSQHTLEVQRMLNQLLFQIGGPNALAEILRNIEGGGGTTLYLSEGIHYLGEAKYRPGYEFCKRIAEDEEADSLERMEALWSMSMMASQEEKQEILTIAEKIKAYKPFSAPLDQRLHELIRQLKNE